MTTGWNYLWGESWHEYIQRSTATDDLTSAYRESAQQMVKAISGQTASILSGMDIGRQSIAAGIDEAAFNMESGMNSLADQMESLGSKIDTLGTIMSSGFNLLNSQMAAIAGEISDLNVNFKWGFGQIIAQIGGMNDSLESLIQIAKTPVQTWAYNQFEIARENFRKGLYENCLKRLDKAINGDATSAGYEEEWRFHQLAGVIRLGYFGCDVSLIDLPLAERSFLMASRYAKVDHAKEAARALLSAGWSAYVQGKLPESLLYTEQALALDTHLGEALFQAAKIKMSSNSPNEGLDYLRKALDLEPGYLVKAAADGDFQKHERELNAFYEGLRLEQFNRLAPKLEKALREGMELAKTNQELVKLEDIFDRWRGLLGGSVGLIELLIYAKIGFENDLIPLKNIFHCETMLAKVEREVDEPYQEEEVYEADEPYQFQEEYNEEVIVKAKGLFSKEKTTLVTKTRTVTKSRKVQKTRMGTKYHKVWREIEEEKKVIANALGEIYRIDLPVHHFTFARIPAGKFIMGKQIEELGIVREEVTISKPFLIMTTPVTEALYASVMGCLPEYPDADKTSYGKDKPVSVSWYQAKDFIDRINKIFNTENYRLPTSAEWEYACRAGTTGIAYGPIDAIAWSFEESGGRKQPVGLKQPNAWGLYDMLGNVMEWCQHWCSPGEYKTPSGTDPQGPSKGTQVVIRGCATGMDASNCRADNYAFGPPDSNFGIVGFRVVCAPARRI